MIIDSIDRAFIYEKISPAFTLAMKFLYENRNGGLTKERYELSEDVYVLVMRYSTKMLDNCYYEAHKNYIDVQYLVLGNEYMGWAPKSKMTEETYIEEKDLYRMNGKGDLYPLHGGEFMILFPEDAHMPCVQYGDSAKVEKIILKIRVGEEK